MSLPRQWKLETVVSFCAGLLLCVSAGLFLAIALRKLLPGLPESKLQFYSSVVSTLFFQGATLVLAGVFLRQNEAGWKSFLGFDQPQLKPVVVRAFAVTALVLPMALVVMQGSQMLVDHFRGGSEIQPAIRIIQISISPAQLFYTGVLAIVLAPVAEEILFRGILYPAMKQLGWRWTGLIGSSLLFSATHAHLPTFLPLALLGFVFALLYDRTSTLLAPILAHATFNLFNFAYILVHQRGGS